MVKKDKIIDKESKIINLTMDLTREKAIEMILGENSEIDLNISIDCSVIDEEKIGEIVDTEIDNEIEDLKRSCLMKIKEINKKRKEFKTLPTHEILEEGEKLGLWKLTEKQKRLNRYLKNKDMNKGPEK